LLSSKRVLVACHHVGVAGGLYRFDRVAAVLGRRGHELAFLAFGDPFLQTRPTDVPILTFAQAAQTRWDAVMVPGAGFSKKTIDVPLKELSGGS